MGVLVGVLISKLNGNTAYRFNGKISEFLLTLKFLVLENSTGTDKYFQNYGKVEVNIEH